MRSVTRLAAVLILPSACQMQNAKSGVDGSVEPQAPDAITATALDAPVPSEGALTPAVATNATVQVPGADTPRPVPREAAVTDMLASDLTDAETAPQTWPQVSPERALCEKSGGQWAENSGSSGWVCVRRTRDSDKFCRKKSDCQGECLARSNTCAAIAPLMGCDDILQSNGTEVTLCLQ